MPRRYATWISSLFFVFGGLLHAQRNSLKPKDFAPLTSLPWVDVSEDTTEVLTTIFLEPDTAIRYAVLATFLKLIPEDRLGAAFDLCVQLEGTQNPNRLVELFLPIWAQRDPKECWSRARNLFRLVGIEYSWLSFDSWDAPRITVQDSEAIRASHFRLRRGALRGFPLGVDRSSLAAPERVNLMREFTETWFAAFGTWPGYDSSSESDFPVNNLGLMAVFETSTESLRSQLYQVGTGLTGAGLEMTCRRLLKLDPASAPEVMAVLSKRSQSPPIGLLMVWAEADLPGMILWVSSDNPFPSDIQAFLMSRVDASTRERWIAAAKNFSPGNDDWIGLLDGWAVWDPKVALKAAISTGNAEAIRNVAVAGAYGPQINETWNVSHHGLGVIKDFDLTTLPLSLRREVLTEWGITIMEQWGDIDIGEAARYGFELLVKTDYIPREQLISLFGGSDEFADDSNMVDRTFCALRTWAVIRPQEMETWIKTLQDKEMQKALSWLLENPWGNGPTE